MKWGDDTWVVALSGQGELPEKGNPRRRRSGSRWVLHLGRDKSEVFTGHLAMGVTGMP